MTLNMAAEIERRRARTISWFVPVVTKNPLNSRQHWRVVSKRAAEEKEITLLSAPHGIAVVLPCVVILARCSQRTLDAHDGLRAALKHVADGVAEWIGVDDREGAGIRFQYEQEYVRKADSGVRVTVVQGARIVESLELFYE
jgi:hypothetical protein